jgi:hypothetical protein
LDHLSQGGKFKIFFIQEKGLRIAGWLYKRERMDLFTVLIDQCRDIAGSVNTANLS